LAKWVTTQRSWRDRLSDDRISKLESLPGWSWDKKGDLWEKGFKELLKYIEINNTPEVPTRYKTNDDYSLGAWCHKVRATKSRGKLSDERIKRLESITGWKWVMR
jgi:hypothetical protein